MLFILSLTLLSQKLVVLIDNKYRRVPIKLLHRIVKDSASCLIHLIRLAFAPGCILNPVLFIFLHLLLDIEQVCLAFFEDLVAFGCLGICCLDHLLFIFFVTFLFLNYLVSLLLRKVLKY